MLGKEQMAAAELMIQQMQSVPLWLLLVRMGLVPAIFEELCFRGFLFGALRTKLADDRTVIASSLLFGLFHEILIPGRLLASTFLGGVLGWVRLRSRSVLPGMVLHATHNCLLLTMAHYRDDIIARGWDLEDTQHLPALWFVGAAIGVVLAVGLIVASTRRVGVGMNRRSRGPPGNRSRRRHSAKRSPPADRPVNVRNDADEVRLRHGVRRHVQARRLPRNENRMPEQRNRPTRSIHRRRV